jgi:restriction system protein
VLTRIFFGANSATKSPASFQAVHVPSYIIERAGTLKSRRAELSAAFQSKFTEEHQKLERLRQHCIAGKPEAINLLMKVSHIRHPLPSVLLKAFETNLDLSARVILCGVEIPDFAGLSIVRKRGTSYKAKWQPVSATERRRSVETILYGLCLRAAYLAANSDVANVFDTVAVNATQSWHDPATGKPCEGIIASLQAPKADLLQLHIGQLDAKACFRYLKGITTPSVDQISPVRPIFVMNTDDRRIIENRDVVDQLDREANLAAMPWEDFEHLVRQLFEWEFGRNGVEVKVTRASRDRGVDAIMFDPDPLRGGQICIASQALYETC